MAEHPFCSLQTSIINIRVMLRSKGTKIKGGQETTPWLGWIFSFLTHQTERCPGDPPSQSSHQSPLFILKLDWSFDRILKGFGFPALACHSREDTRFNEQI